LVNTKSAELLFPSGDGLRRYTDLSGGLWIADLKAL
jgi:hypothetical protein